MDALERLQATLCWLDKRLDCFNPMPGDKPDFTCLKAFAELSIAVLYLEEYRPRLVGDTRLLDGFLKRAVGFLRVHCERAEYVEAARREPLLGYAYALPYLTLRGTGHRSERQESLLQWLQARRMTTSVEMVPYRHFDRAHFLWKGGVAKRTSWRRLCQATVLARRDGAIYYEDDDAYSATHTLFYLTDFGLRPAELNEAEKKRTEGVLHCLLVHAWRLKNWDLLGEILICLNYLRAPMRSLRLAAEGHFATLLREDGTVPPHAVPAKKRKQGQKQRNAIGWDEYGRHCYHTTLVYVLYVLSSLGPDGTSS